MAKKGLFCNVGTPFSMYMDGPLKLSEQSGFGQGSKKVNPVWLKIWLRWLKMAYSVMDGLPELYS